MAKLGDLVVRIGADTRDLNKQLGRVQRNMRGMTNNVQNLGRSISQGLTLPLAGMAALSVKAFRDQAKAVAQVEQGLKSTGNAANRTLGDLTKMASDLQKTTLFGDEDILQNATAQLLTFTNITGKEFDRTQKAALDLATRLGGDLKGASIQLGKALNDPVANLSALSRSGIQFSKDQKALIKTLAETGELAKAQGIILDELEKQYGGSAEAAAAADGGITQLQNALGDLGEDIGKIITQNLQPFIKRVMSIVEGFQGLDDGVKRAIVALAGLAAAFGPILFFLPQIITQLGLLATAIAANPILAAAGVITAIGVALKAMTSDAKEARTSIEELRDSFKELDSETKEQKRADIVETIKQIFRYKELVEQIRSIRDEFEGQAFAQQKTIRATNRFKEALSETDKAILKNVGAMIKSEGALVDMTDPIERANDLIIDLQNKLAALTEQEVVNTEVVEEEAKAYQSLGGAIEESMHAITNFDAAGYKSRQTLGQFFSMLENVQVQAKATNEEIVQTTNSLQGFTEMIANSFGQAAAQAETFRQAALILFKSLITGALAAAKAQAVANAAQAGAQSGPAAPIVMAATLSAMIGLINSIPIPELATGGLAFGPTTAIVGDNMNARIDPEVIAPLSKLKDMLGGNQVQVVGRISGTDILLANDRATRDRNRIA